jgi:23S rRNA (guanosine2251-2'-O)-methyltransferase
MEKKQVRYKFKAPLKKYLPTELVFGIHSVLETLRSEKDIDKILINRELIHPELLDLAGERGVQVQRVPVERLNKVTAKNHQGVLAFVSAVNYASLENVVSGVYEAGQVPLILMLDRITDVRNFGAICRSAECAGVQGVVVPQAGSAQINADAMKTSSGALNFVPVCKEASLTRAADYAKDCGMQLVVVSEKGSQPIFEVDLTGPIALVMGSEEDGIGPEIIDKADHVVYIPMQGQVGSLNVSVATGIALFEAVRQRHSQ